VVGEIQSVNKMKSICPILIIFILSTIVLCEVDSALITQGSSEEFKNLNEPLRKTNDINEMKDGGVVQLPIKMHRNHKTRKIKLKNHRNVEYHVTLKVGSKGLEYDVLVDTGSSDLWFPATQCNGCKQKKRFHCSMSSSCTTDFSAVVSGRYADGPVTGHVSYDQIRLGNIVIPKQSFLLVNSASGHIANTIGLMGLSFQAISMNYNPTLISNLRQLGIVSKKVFSLYFNADEGSDAHALFLGGYDTNYILAGAKIFYFNLASTMTYMITMKSFEIGVLAVELPKQEALIDSGNSCITLPRWTLTTVRTILQRDYGIKCEFYVEQYAPTFSMMDCIIDKNSKEFPTIRPNINGVLFSMSPADYIYECQETKESTKDDRQLKCYTKIELSEDIKYSVLGMAFHHTYYVIYDLEGRRIGMGRSIADNKLLILDKEGKRLSWIKKTKDAFDVLEKRDEQLRRQEEQAEQERLRNIEREREREQNESQTGTQTTPEQQPPTTNEVETRDPDSDDNQNQEGHQGRNQQQHIDAEHIEEITRLSRQEEAMRNQGAYNSDRPNDKKEKNNDYSANSLVFIIIGVLSLFVIFGLGLWIIRGRCSNGETGKGSELGRTIVEQVIAAENMPSTDTEIINMPPANNDKKLLDGSLFDRKAYSGTPNLEKAVHPNDSCENGRQSVERKTPSPNISKPDIAWGLNSTETRADANKTLLASVGSDRRNTSTNNHNFESNKGGQNISDGRQEQSYIKAQPKATDDSKSIMMQSPSGNVQDKGKDKLSEKEREKEMKKEKELEKKRQKEIEKQLKKEKELEKKLSKKKSKSDKSDSEKSSNSTLDKSSLGKKKKK
jgi:hypothetical protein